MLYYLQKIDNYIISNPDSKIENKEYGTFNNSLFDEYKYKIKKINENRNPKSKFLKKILEAQNSIVNMMLIFMGFDYKDNAKVGMIRLIDNKYKFVDYLYQEIKDKKKRKCILQNMVGMQQYIKISEMDYCKRFEALYTYYIDCINLLPKYLLPNGNVLFTFFNNCVPDRGLEIIFLLRVMFEKVILIHGGIVFCYNYISPLQLTLPYNFIINFATKNQLKKELILKLTNMNKKFEKMMKYFVDSRYDDFINLYLENNKSIIMKLEKRKEYFNLQIQTMKRLFLNDKIVRIHSNINLREGDFLSQLINLYKCKDCLEIGFAFGISAYYIITSHKKVNLISIDPYQKSEWNNYGIELIKKFGLEKRHKLFEEKSYLALPLMVKESKKFDFIFIDGFHTFDYTLLDIFYSIKLLKKNGIIAIDDVMHDGVKQVIDYIDKNYKEIIRLIPNDKTNTVRAYKLIAEDTRGWNFHVSF